MGVRALSVGWGFLCLLSACGQDERSAAKAQGHALTAEDGSTGVALCDSYLDQYEGCMQSVLPESLFNQQKSGIKRQRQQWRQMADTPFKRESLSKVCLRALELVRQKFPDCEVESVSCGNGVMDAGEQCDDGNTQSGDGCSAACSIEPVCGDGVLAGSEQCDDGNTQSGDGCSAACSIEPVCGDGVLAGSEQCDDGNTQSGDGCSATCVVESPPAAICDVAQAIDLGAPGQSTEVSSDACVRVRDGYPGWWGTNRGMQLQTQQGGTYPVPFTWSNSCVGSSGNASFTSNWQSRIISPTSDQCATLIRFGGDGSGRLRLVYYSQ